MIERLRLLIIYTLIAILAVIFIGLALARGPVASRSVPPTTEPVYPALDS